MIIKHKKLFLIFFVTSNSYAISLDQAYFQLAQSLQEQGNVQEAIIQYKNALLKNPTHEQSLYNLRLLHKNQQAHELFDKAHELIVTGQTKQAVEIYQKLLAQSPHNPTLLHNIAHAYKKQGDLEQAINFYHQALTIQPTNTKIHLGLAHSYLAQGNMVDGFKELAASNTFTLDSHEELTCLDAVDGKRIFITTNWVIEDTILFLRYVKLLHDKGATIIMQTPHELAPLLKNCDYIDRIITKDSKTLPTFDMYVPLLSIPALCTSVDAIPTGTTYLQLSCELSEKWKKILSHDSNLTIGLYIPQKPSNQNQENSISLQSFAPLAQLSGISLYSLHPLRTQDLINLPHEMLITTFGGRRTKKEDDILALTAIMGNLDLIVTNDSLIAHLAGALGKQTFFALDHTGEWYWQHSQSTSVWYPSVRLFQPYAAMHDNISQEIVKTIEKSGKIPQ